MDIQANGQRFHVVDEGAGRPVIAPRDCPGPGARRRRQMDALAWLAGRACG